MQHGVRCRMAWSPTHLSNAASNLEHMPFSVISVTQMKVRGESASGLKSLHMQGRGACEGMF